MSERTRSLELQILLDVAEVAIQASGQGPAATAAQLVFRRLNESSGDEVGITAERLPVCRYLHAIAANMAMKASPLPELASAFMAVEPRFCWSRRKGADPKDQPFYDGHANATIIGASGIEERNDVWIGVSLMAPDVTYPKHSHPPEEVYLAMTEGEWWNSNMKWTEPGAGKVIYNPPGILHAMRSGGQPFLALWFLPVY